MTEVQVDVSEGEEVSGIVQNVNSGEVLVFPSGTFTWSDEVVLHLEDWGIRCEPDTVFQVPDGFGEGSKELLLKTDGGGSTSSDNYYLENLTFDSVGRSSPGMALACLEVAHINGLEYRMNGPFGNNFQTNGLAVTCKSDTGTLRIDDYKQFNNGDIGQYEGSTRIGVYARNSNVGTIHLVNPVLSGFPNNGCYVSRTPGSVIIEGGLLMNNNVSAVRVSGGVEVYDTTVVIDTDAYRDGAGQLTDGAHNTRGFWGDGNHDYSKGGLISGCDVILQSYERSTGLVSNGFQNDKLDVRDTQYLVNASLDGVLQAGDNVIDVDNSTFDGGSTGSTLGTTDTGSITGSSDNAHPDFDFGAVPIASTDNYGFDWSLTHPETPNRTTESGTTVEFDHLLEIVAESDVDSMGYAVTTSGELQKGAEANGGESVVQNDDGSWTGTGSVAGSGIDSFEFNGSVTDWTAELDSSSYTVYIDGTEATELYDTTTDPDHLLEIVAESDVDSMGYAVTTSGELQKGAEADGGESVVQNDDGSWTGTGSVAGSGIDSFEFNGSVTDWTAELDSSSYTVYIDGTEATELYDTTTDPDHLLEIVAESDVDSMGYAVTTSGELQKGAEADGGETIVQNDDGTYTATGSVAGSGIDSFEFNGSVTDWTAELDSSSYTVYIDGTEASEIHETRLLEIVADNSKGALEFSITTDGKLFKGPEADDKEKIIQNADGTWTATGKVRPNGVDSFEFYGSVLDVATNQNKDAYTLTIDGTETSL
ncbi:hypothetical protein [Halorarius litoreus]|uniref:hypothetical protein n=1 Tax=Halorarius litoreus TaxID=2962676 RepID=UPI0020CC0B5F|nr:hypothetical protein [Halorarius litoreus]